MCRKTDWQLEIGAQDFSTVREKISIAYSRTNLYLAGDPELKSILQLLCCSIAGKKMRYYTFCQLQRLGDVHEKLIQLGATVGSVVSLILKHDTSKSLFDEILELE